MKKEYLTIHHSILPEYYDKVLEAKKLIEEEHQSVSFVCKKLDISRSTYYKYKDKISYAEEGLGKCYNLSIKVNDNKIALLNIVNEIICLNASILTLHQSLPSNGFILINVTIKTNEDIDNFIKHLKLKCYDINIF